MIKEVTLRVEYKNTANVYTYVYREPQQHHSTGTNVIELSRVRITDPVYSQEEQIRCQPVWSPPPGAPRRRHPFH